MFAVSGEWKDEKKVVLSHSATSHLFLASGSVSFSDAFAPGNIILVQFHTENYGELTLLRENTQFKAVFAEICMHLPGKFLFRAFSD